jgi:hypothetical protein
MSKKLAGLLKYAILLAIGLVVLLLASFVQRVAPPQQG